MPATAAAVPATAATITMPAAATTTAVPATTALAPPVRVSCRRRQQSRSNRRRDQQSFQAHHGYNSFVSFSSVTIWNSTMVGLRQHQAGLMILSTHSACAADRNLI
jgi:hypothetical protein